MFECEYVVAARNVTGYGYDTGIRFCTGALNFTFVRCITVPNFSSLVVNLYIYCCNRKCNFVLCVRNTPYPLLCG